MTVQQMHDSFKVGLDKTDSLNYPNFLTAEVDLFLNQAQERFIKQRYSTTNPKRQSFEETQKRTDDLREVVVNSNLTPVANTTTNKPNGKFVTLPADYWFAINEECTVTYTDCHSISKTKRIPVKAIHHNDYNYVIKDPFNKPYNDEVVRLMYQDSAEVITDGSFTVDTYHLRYIKKPVLIDLDTPTNCELADHTHQEIVDMAVSIALENIESRRYPTNINELNKQE